ncbi:hypothetical protein A6J89_007700 [Pasteurella multocida]|uniref:hypothetical protein n=1 Tax=Pasteurella multocida TaxID=747 RepID=UPI0009F2A8A7|nr:hypothetical protein [Pasteurella multocida]PNM03674.1 hypothetical protein A6J89_007700 [Pasteurella multocida]
MAKKDKEKSVKDTETTKNATNSSADNDIKTTEGATGSNVDTDVKAEKKQDDVKADALDTNVIQPVGYSVKLRDIHPQDSYGRCGYRFNKTEPTYFSVDELTGEQVVTLAEDPWLELIPVCEE